VRRNSCCLEVHSLFQAAAACALRDSNNKPLDASFFLIGIRHTSPIDRMLCESEFCLADDTTLGIETAEKVESSDEIGKTAESHDSMSSLKMSLLPSVPKTGCY